MEVVAAAPSTWRRALWWIAAGGLVVVWSVLLLVQPEITGKPFGADAIAYHSAPLDSPYGGPQIGLSGAYLYPPPFLQALAPLRLLPWEAFMAIWVAMELFALAWLLTPPVALLALAIPFVLAEVTIGNVHLFMAVAIVLAIRNHPSAWAFVALTKPTSGVAGAWHLFRREWREAAIALATVVAIVATSMLIGFELWVQWLDRMGGDVGTAGTGWMVALAARVVLALVIVGVAAVRRRPLLLPVAAFVALPITWPEGLTLLAAIPRLSRYR